MGRLIGAINSWGASHESEGVRDQCLSGASMRALFQIVSVFQSLFQRDLSAPRWRVSIPPLSFEAGVVFAAMGMAAYFSLPFEPPFGLLALILAFIALCTYWVSRRETDDGLDTLLTAVLLLTAGLFWSSVQTQRANPNPLTYEQRLDVTGYVSAIDDRGAMRRLRIEIEALDTIPVSGAPKAIRIRVGRAFSDLKIGDKIKLPVVAGPLPGPVVPNGYDPARRGYYDGLAGSGFAIANAERASFDLSWRAQCAITMAQFRSKLAEAIISQAPEETAGLQAALLTGIRDYIPEDQTAALRASGLAHILAISGLHMGMVAFGVFAVFSFSLALIEPWSRRRDMRKPAAVMAMIVATGYLLLSGGSVATQRAFIMVSIAFLAVIFDRRALSMRSVAVAALLTLLIRPEAITSVGFQMSFAAVAALIAAYRFWQDRRPQVRTRGLRKRFVDFYGSLAMTSTIAGFATAGFALFHFGRVANYGLLGNLAAMSVFPAVMACGLISLTLMPLGLAEPMLALMGYLISFMIKIAHWVANLPGAVGHVKSSTPWVLGVYGLGFVVACFGSRASLLGGAALMAAGLIGWGLTPLDDLRVTDTGRVSLITEQGGVTSSLRADRYGRERFAQAKGDPELEWQNYYDDFAQCDALACRLERKGRIISVVEEASEVPQACQDSDLVILPERRAGPVARRGCEAVLIDGDELRRSGGLHIRLTEPLIITPLLTQSRSRRPWGDVRSSRD